MCPEESTETKGGIDLATHALFEMRVGPSDSAFRSSGFLSSLDKTDG